MASSTIRILSYDTDSTYRHNLIMGSQIDLMAYDTPCDPSIGYWFIAHEVETDKVVGFGCLKVTALEGYGYLARSGVSSDYRGQGIQARLIRARERKARSLGLTHMVCDTSNNNHASSNSLIRCGYKLYEPKARWAFSDGLYWIKRL